MAAAVAHDHDSQALVRGLLQREQRPQRIPGAVFRLALEACKLRQRVHNQQPRAARPALPHRRVRNLLPGLPERLVPVHHHKIFSREQLGPSPVSKSLCLNGLLGWIVEGCGGFVSFQGRHIPKLREGAK